MKPLISEFSYGYAITDELVHAQGSGVQGAPVFPSLYEEGQPGGGYDVRINRVASPLFLQFKLAHKMERRSAVEHRSGVLGVPCYRFHLMALRDSPQHDLLLDLEARGHSVYYVAPMFHKPDELDGAYTGRTVRRDSFWVKPSQIGTLPDQDAHHVSFTRGGSWALFSSPERRETRCDYESLENEVRLRVGERRGRKLGAPEVEGLVNDVVEVAESRMLATEMRARPSQVKDMLRMALPLDRVAYLASTFLGCRVFLMSLGDTGNVSSDGASG